MREADRRTIEDIGIPSLVLMENAGRQAVAAMEAMYSDLSDRQVAVLCGRGNNGGDGFVIARTLVQRGIDVAVFLIGSVGDVRGDARVNLEILGRLGLTVVEVADSQAWELHFSEVSDCTLIVDAIFGTGLNAPVAGFIESVIADVNTSGIPVVSIDLPSGLSADSAEPIGPSIEAGLTITIAAPKLPLVLPPGELRAGDIVIADIGIPIEVLDNVTGPRVELLTRGAMREIVVPRTADSHKGDYGRVLLVAGSRGKTGAAHLAAVGALRSGAGLVTVATPASCQPVLAVMAPEYMTEALEEADGGLAVDEIDRVLEMARDVVAIGPGLGQAPATRNFIQQIVDRATMPLVIDADGLNAFQRSRPAHRTRRPRHHHHAASRRDGAAGRHVDARSPGASAGDRPQLRLRPPAVRRAERPPHADRDAGRQGVHQPDGEPGDGDRRHRRRSHRDDCRLAGAAARRRGGVQARRVLARPGRRPGRGRRRRGCNDVGRRCRPSRRRDARAHRPPQACR